MSLINALIVLLSQNFVDCDIKNIVTCIWIYRQLLLQSWECIHWFVACHKQYESLLLSG